MSVRSYPKIRTLLLYNRIVKTIQ